MENLIKRCIECEGRDLIKAKKDLTFKRGNPDIIKIKNQECVECKNCGELYFDEEQSTVLARKIDEIERDH